MVNLLFHAEGALVSFAHFLLCPREPKPESPGGWGRPAAGREPQPKHPCVRSSLLWLFLGVLQPAARSRPELGLRLGLVFSSHRWMFFSMNLSSSFKIYLYVWSLRTLKQRVSPSDWTLVGKKKTPLFCLF